jgi:hypothetical protein
MFTADLVWALAAAADRINGGYFKEDVYDFHVDQKNPVKRANKIMLKTWLRENTTGFLNEEDYAAGRSARDHFKTYTLLAMTGKLNDFQKTAMKLAAKDEFSTRDLYDFAVISCLPEVAKRDQSRTEIKREVFGSEQLAGAVGDTVVGDIEIVNSRFSAEYNKHRYTARMGESFVDFWHPATISGTARIKAKIKQHRGDKTTQLNYVKIVG